MAKTKAELLNENCDLKKENLKLTNTIRQMSEDEDKRRAIITKWRREVAGWKEIAQKQNDGMRDLIKKLEECEKEKTLIKSQRDVLLKEAEEHLYQINDLQESFDILQAQVRKIQINEEVIHDQGYEEGYADAEHKYQQALDNREKEIEDMSDACHLYYWIIKQLHENATK